jgi:NAD(P)-dependent dehydrogenase (short-subunit alcohol dehydrogenase family)
MVLISRTRAELTAAMQEITQITEKKIVIFPADISDPRAVKKMADFTLNEFQRIDILVNCAGIQGPIGLSADVDAYKWLDTIKINLFGTFLCTRAVLPDMVKNKNGKIINFSGGGAVSPRSRFSAYAASKAAVVRLTENLAVEYKDFSIDINAIAPGSMNTRMLEETLKAGEKAGKEAIAQSLKQKQEGGVPPERITELAVFLASSQSDGLTGRLISVLWDKWRDIPQHLEKIMSSDIYAMRRIVPKDRGYDW